MCGRDVQCRKARRELENYIIMYWCMHVVCIFIVTCVGRSKAPAAPLRPLLYEVCGMANIERSITKLLNDDIILALAHPVMAS